MLISRHFRLLKIFFLISVLIRSVINCTGSCPQVLELELDLELNDDDEDDEVGMVEVMVEVGEEVGQVVVTVLEGVRLVPLDSDCLLPGGKVEGGRLSDTPPLGGVD